ncbi:MAG: ectonucleotide pyrophosphatase/phosphodiesterase [Treponema sp.]|nr:ectonucleotide pyrophosphatase/phosphodiesterase [Treponema sp.]
MGVLVISFDAVGDKVFEAMAEDGETYPNVARFRRDAYYRGGIKTVFVSNTYPVHASISTGKLPRDHGIVSNLLPPGKNGERPWAQMAKYMKARTIWDAAREKNLSTAAMLWPVTCGAKIDYHMPEVHLEKGQNLLFRSLLYGSVFFQLSALFRHGGKLVKAIRGIGQPELDDFTTSVTCDMLKKTKPDLTLVHLIAYDTLFHHAGSRGMEMDTAKKAMDTNLGRLLESWGDDTAIVFSDHSQLDVAETVNLNTIYGDAVFEQVGGSAFLDRAAIAKAACVPEEQPWFCRRLTKDELAESGYSDRPVIGIAAKPGYAFSEGKKYKGNHGYPADYENYGVFYGVRGRNWQNVPEQGHAWLKNRVTDITAIIARELNLDMDILDEYGAGQHS